MMNEFKLLVFHKVATGGSFSKAAEDLYVSQPAVTKQISSLEDELGIKLFERNNKGIALTAAGKLFLEHTGVILAQYKRLKNDMSLLSEQVSGELTIGASTTIAQYVLPPVLAQFRQANPSLKLTLLNENSKTVEDLLQKHEINLGIIEGLPANSALQYTLFIKDELVLITHKSSIYYRLEACSLNDLRKSDLVLRENGSGTLEVFGDFIRQYGLKLDEMNTLIQLGSTESIKLFLKHADAIGVVSIQALKEEILSGEFKVIELEEGRIFRNFYFVHQKGTPEKLVNNFIAFLKNRYNVQL
ncbi:MAG: LysR family transcriptional regulator [Ignavibacteria bacterium]|jgi:DNA-binding transcriptional LysR family regulator|nr:LysR family transcriptional regulator [Ignavibacteria bacterium]MCU7502109.1 LysR family transcriptional regulator [Ignavibacteria bacterium]MCU7515511.1 LysR family transcriptional regulator [Ignavibacteria bacterium]